MSTTVKNWVTVKRGDVFKQLSSRPENWRFNGFCTHRVSKCELCATPIVWQYELENTDGRKLLVGSECVKWYYEAYMPNGLELAIELMKKAHKVVKGGIIAEKLEEFQHLFPQFVDYLLGATRRGYRDMVLSCIVPDNEARKRIYVSKFRASIRRKGYLKTEELKALCSGYELSQWGKAFEGRASEINQQQATV